MVHLTNVNDMTILVHHDVAVVPVLDLEQEAEHRVGRHRGDEGPPRILERGARLVAVLLLEVVEEVGVGAAAQLVAGLGVRDALDDAAARLGGHHLVGEEVEVEAVLLEDVLEEGDDLEGEDVLPTVVPHLHIGKVDSNPQMYKNKIS